MEFSSSALVAFVMAVMCVWVGAGESATDCSSALAGVEGCATFLTNPSSTPDQKECCDPLKTVLETPASFQCICAQATGSDTSPLFKNALLLPNACKLNINVSAANCTSSTTPATTTPASNTSTTPATPMTASPMGSGSGGFISAAPYLPLVAVPFFYSIAQLCL